MSMHIHTHAHMYKVYSSCCFFGWLLCWCCCCWILSILRHIFDIVRLIAHNFIIECLNTFNEYTQYIWIDHIEYKRRFNWRPAHRPAQSISPTNHQWIVRTVCPMKTNEIEKKYIPRQNILECIECAFRTRAQNSVICCIHTQYRKQYIFPAHFSLWFALHLPPYFLARIPSRCLSLTSWVHTYVQNFILAMYFSIFIPSTWQVKLSVFKAMINLSIFYGILSKIRLSALWKLRSAVRVCVHRCM